MQIFAEEIPPYESQQYLEIESFTQENLIIDLTNSFDLVIMVKSFNPLTDSNVYISRKNINPQSVQDSDELACEAKGTYICVLTKSQVIPGELLFLAVVSRFPCRFSIRIDQDQELLLTPNGFLMFKMNSTQESKVIQIDVGELGGKFFQQPISFYRPYESKIKENQIIYLEYKWICASLSKEVTAQQIVMQITQKWKLINQEREIQCLEYVTRKSAQTINFSFLISQIITQKCYLLSGNHSRSSKVLFQNEFLQVQPMMPRFQIQNQVEYQIFQMINNKYIQTSVMDISIEMQNISHSGQCLIQKFQIQCSH